jgi:hypothetical protein
MSCSKLMVDTETWFVKHCKNMGEGTTSLESILQRTQTSMINTSSLLDHPISTSIGTSSVMKSSTSQLVTQQPPETLLTRIKTVTLIKYYQVPRMISYLKPDSLKGIKLTWIKYQTPTSVKLPRITEHHPLFKRHVQNKSEVRNLYSRCQGNKP